jgi:hypothetical protein
MLNKTILFRNFVNSLSHKSSKKIVVIESDDWGAIRMPSKKVYNDLVQKQIIRADDPFTKYDSLASEDDLALLFEVLSSVKGSDGSPVVLTADCIMANPDFKKIKQSGFREYHYESVVETLNKYPKHANCFDIWKQGISQNIFKPQLHGREHVNVLPWLNYLQQNKNEYIEAFERETYAVNANIVGALNFYNQTQREYLDNVINDACLLFEKIFDFKSKTFIAPNYIWDSYVEQSLNNNNITYLQGSKTQNIPTITGGIKKKYHYTGQKNKLNQTYLVRNCLFEPSISPNLDYVSICMKHVSNAFFWKTPAIISSHRLNYVGFLEESNRDKNLKQLKMLLKMIVKEWPEVVFMSSDELINEIQ